MLLAEVGELVGEAVGVEQLGLPVVVDVAERHAGDHTGLSDTTTLLLSEVVGLLDELGVADKDGADWGTHGLGEADGDGVEELTELLQWDVGLGDGVPDTGTVTVQLHAVLHTPGLDSDELL